MAETLRQALHSLAEARGGTLAVVGASRSLTWAELEREVVQIASALHAEGVRPGQRVGLMLPRVPELAVTFLALARVGAVVVPINHKLQLKWVVAQLEDIDFLVADPELAKALPTDVAADLRWMTPEHLGKVASRGQADDVHLGVADSLLPKLYVWEYGASQACRHHARTDSRECACDGSGLGAVLG